MLNARCRVNLDLKFKLHTTNDFNFYACFGHKILTYYYYYHYYRFEHHIITYKRELISVRVCLCVCLLFQPDNMTLSFLRYVRVNVYAENLPALFCFYQSFTYFFLREV